VEGERENLALDQKSYCKEDASPYYDTSRKGKGGGLLSSTLLRRESSLWEKENLKKRGGHNQTYPLIRPSKWGMFPPSGSIGQFSYQREGKRVSFLLKERNAPLPR